MAATIDRHEHTLAPRVEQDALSAAFVAAARPNWTETAWSPGVCHDECLQDHEEGAAPPESRRGPPLLPGLIAASVCTHIRCPARGFTSLAKPGSLEGAGAYLWFVRYNMTAPRIHTACMMIKPSGAKSPEVTCAACVRFYGAAWVVRHTHHDSVHSASIIRAPSDDDNRRSAGIHQTMQ